ncbi:ABC transporter substrate-binding protein [Kyrpidia spormannii]|uniref:Myristoyl transferase n=2 Tax=Kyrpidia spormannii TaxID=2055160 RepID=A0ACA8ZCN4_9BACL|nr:ABC transporter substrate-binding protein [Kyrpidia spormannii]CAB3395310.1 Myristoyl transferase [Kyrpidia spormannii]CAB3396081.1 Myristoyl transferase [Kyrpidia spormannii]
MLEKAADAVKTAVSKILKGLLPAFLAVGLVALTACGGGGQEGSSPAGSGSGSGPSAKVKLQLKWVPQAQFAGYFVAKEKGFYKDEGLDVEILPGGPDIVPEQQVANGAADIGVDWVASLLAHQEQGLPLVEIAQIYQKSGLILISKKTSGINSPADLKGKKVGNWMGGNEFELLALFDKYHLDPKKDLQFIKQGFTMDQFLTGQLDAASAMTYNEYNVVLEQGVSPGDLNIINMNKEGVAMLEDNLFANKNWLSSNKDVAVKFVRASVKGWKYAIDHPDEAVDIVMKSVEQGSTTRDHQLKMMQEVAKLVLPQGMDPSKIGTIDDQQFKQTADIALKFGVIHKPADLSTAYTKEVIDAALK